MDLAQLQADDTAVAGAYVPTLCVLCVRTTKGRASSVWAYRQISPSEESG